MVFFFWNVHVFFIILLRLEAVRVENRGGLKNIAQTLMARGILPNLYMYTMYIKLAFGVYVLHVLMSTI